MMDGRHPHKIPLMDLYEHTSPTGTRLLRGRLGKLQVVGFIDRDAPEDNSDARWNLFVEHRQPHEH